MVPVVTSLVLICNEIEETRERDIADRERELRDRENWKRVDDFYDRVLKGNRNRNHNKKQKPNFNWNIRMGK